MSVLFSIKDDFRYDIVRKIFEGGMAVVYEAEQHGAKQFVKRVAIKVIRQSFADQLRDKNRILPAELAVFITSRVARGLAYAHAKTDRDGRNLGIVHRDVSFKNIMIAFEGDVKLTDFGIAKARGFLQDQEGEVVAGKADYMSPEQANFQITDRRSDIFSTGVVLGHLLLGYNIFKGQTPDDSRERVMSMQIPDFRKLDPRIDERLNTILHRALARDIDQRYKTADDLMVDLEKYIYGTGYGPTNETLGRFIREIFGQRDAGTTGDTKGGTLVVDRRAVVS